MGYVWQGLCRNLRGTSGDDIGEELEDGSKEGADDSNGPLGRLVEVWQMSSGIQDEAATKVSTPISHCKGGNAMVGGKTGVEGPASLVFFWDF